MNNFRIFNFLIFLSICIASQAQTISVQSTIKPFTACEATPSVAQSLIVKGNGLTGDISIQTGAGFELQDPLTGNYNSQITLPQTGGAVNVRLKSGKAGNYSGMLTISSPETTSPAIALEGTILTTDEPSVKLLPSKISAGDSAKFTATALNTSGGKVQYDFRINNVSQQKSEDNTWNGGPLSANDNVSCLITITDGKCLKTTFALSDNVKAIDEGFELNFVGNGNIQQSLSDGAEVPANTGVGFHMYEKLPEQWQKLLINKKYGFSSIFLELTYQFASTVDTLKADFNNNQELTNRDNFGNSILTPRNSKEGFYGAFKIYFSKDMKPTRLVSGWYGGFSYGSRYWSYESQKDTFYARTKVMALATGLFHEFIPDRSDLRKNYSAILGVGFISRIMTGNLALNSNNDFRTKILNTDQTRFYGFEILIGAKLKNIKLEVHIPYFIAKGEQVAGLTSWNPYNFISFTGGFPLKLN